MNCTPTGSPAGVNAAGSVNAGWPDLSKGAL